MLSEMNFSEQQKDHYDTEAGHPLSDTCMYPEDLRCRDQFLSNAQKVRELEDSSLEVSRC